MPASALDPVALAAGTTQSGRSGSLVWVADPVEARNRTVVTVVTRHASSGLTDTAGWFLLASLLTLAIGAAVAVVVGRRLGRPVRQADDAARRIAAGELSTRLTPPRGRPGDELVDLAHAINTMAESLERSRTLEQQFLLSVSHDLRTPLTSIRGYAEAISDGTAPDVGRAAAVITRESRRLERLVADLLDLARLDARSFSLVPVEVDLGHAAEGAVIAAQPQAERLGLTYAVTVPPERVTVSADPERLGPGDRQPPRERPEVRPDDRDGQRRGQRRRERPRRQTRPSWRSRTTVRASPTRTSPTSSSGSTSPPTDRPAARTAPASGWPSSSSWSRPWAGPCGPNAARPAAPASSSPSPSPRRGRRAMEPGRRCPGIRDERDLAPPPATSALFRRPDPPLATFRLLEIATAIPRRRALPATNLTRRRQGSCYRRRY